MLTALTTNFHFGNLSVTECFAAVYGDGGARQFWEVECAEPVAVQQFVRLLTVTLEPSEFGNVGRPDLEKQVRDMALGATLVALYQSDPANRVFAGDLSSLATARHGSDLRRELKVHIRPATERILAMPKRRHLVPKSLAEFVEAKERAPVEGAPLHASKPMDESTQDKATKFMLRFFKEAYDAKLPKPRITGVHSPPVAMRSGGSRKTRCRQRWTKYRITISASVAGVTDNPPTETRSGDLKSAAFHHSDL